MYIVLGIYLFPVKENWLKLLFGITVAWIENDGHLELRIVENLTTNRNMPPTYLGP